MMNSFLPTPITQVLPPWIVSLIWNIDVLRQLKLKEFVFNDFPKCVNICICMHMDK